MEIEMETTINKLMEYRPARGEMDKLISFGVNGGPDAPVSFKAILDAFGVNFALYALRTVEDREEMRAFAIWCADQVQHLTRDKDKRVAASACNAVYIARHNRSAALAAHQAASYFVRTMEACAERDARLENRDWRPDSLTARDDARELLTEQFRSTFLAA
jgi:hypothetical protein